MSGSKILSEEEKQEMIKDATDRYRGRAFRAAQVKSQEGGLDEYIEFLSANTEHLEISPSRRITNDFKL